MTTFWTDKFDYSGPQNEWIAHVTFTDEARQNPIELNFYIWDLGDNWISKMEQCLKESLGYPVEVTHSYYGNGHGCYDLKRKLDS